MVWNAGLAGASTVMSWAEFSVSPRLAAVTAWTSVDNAGLLLAAVATGAVLMPSKLPAPSAGTCEQAEPNGWSAIAALLDGAEVLMSEELLEPETVLPAASSDPQAERVTAIVEAATSRAPRLRRVLFTWDVLLRVSVRRQPTWPRRGRRCSGPREAAPGSPPATSRGGSGSADV